MTVAIGPPVRAREVFAQRDFRIYWLTSVASQAGSFMQSVTVPFIVYQITGRNFWLGLAGLAGLLPAVALAPVAGSLSDRHDRRMILWWANLVQLSSAVVLWSLSVSGHLNRWNIIAALFVGGIGGGMQYATQLALVPLLVPREYLAAASRVNSVTFPAARSIGPAIAGIVLAHLGPSWTFGTNALSFLVVMWGLLIIHPRPAPVADRLESAWRQFRDGLRYIKAARYRLAIGTGFVGALFAQSMFGLTAGLVAEDYHRGPGMIGNLISCHGFGAILSSWWLVTRSDRHSRGRTVLAGLAFSTVGMVTAVATTAAPMAFVGYGILGIGHVLTGSSIVTVLQIQLDERFRGRVMGVHLMGLQSGMPIGALVGGVVGDEIGLRPTILGFAACVVVFIVIAVRVLDRLARFDEET